MLGEASGFSLLLVSTNCCELLTILPITAAMVNIDIIWHKSHSGLAVPRGHTRQLPDKHKPCANDRQHSSFCYTPTMFFRMAPHMQVIGWLTLLMCLWTTGDLVIDLAFEEPNVAADTNATAEEPDNAAEHLLMPSQRVGSSAPDAVMAAPDLDAFSVAVTLTDTALRAASPPHRPPRHTPVSFSVPLRI